ncbi:MAG: hypothetical protein J7L55_00325, partial [Desulfurococcales archaeon]|nr:hypothetical protein [Desulfurococcales archaeon]
MSKLKVVLQKEIEKAFTQQGPSGIVVWYDPGGTLESLIECDFPREIQVLRYQGSYLALRFELESADPFFEKRWLIYVPEKAPDPSWLRDYELLGEKLDLDLLELLARGFELPISQRLKELLRKHIENAKELALNWDFLIGGQKVTEDVIVNALLSIAFGLPQWNPNEAILIFVTSKDWKTKLEKRGLWEEWHGKLAEWTGLSKTPDDENKLRETLQNVIILSELVEYIPEIAGQFAILPSQNAKRK